MTINQNSINIRSPPPAYPHGGGNIHESNLIETSPVWDKNKNMKDTYSIKTAAQKQADDHTRLMIAARLMAAMVMPDDLCRKPAAKELAAKAVEFTDELLKAVK